MAHYGPHDHWQQARRWKPSHSYGRDSIRKLSRVEKKPKGKACIRWNIITYKPPLCVISPVIILPIPTQQRECKNARLEDSLPGLTCVSSVSQKPSHLPPSATQHNLHHIQHAPQPGSLPCRQTGSDWGDKRRFQLMSYWLPMTVQFTVPPQSRRQWIDLITASPMLGFSARAGKYHLIDVGFEGRYKDWHFRSCISRHHS